MAGQRAKTADLRTECVREALAIIEESGVEGLSLREVSRRLGVSHQAPYKHFRNRDHILAEIVSQSFDAFAKHLDGRPPSGHPKEDLAQMGLAYLEYARAHPLQYRLMFGTPLPDPEEHPEMMERARHAFGCLRDCLRRIAEFQKLPESKEEIDLDALFIWSTVHGLSSILETRAIDTLDLPPGLLARAIPETLRRIGRSLVGKAVEAGHLAPGTD